MGGWEHGCRVQRGAEHWGSECFGERNELAHGARCGHLISGDDGQRADRDFGEQLGQRIEARGHGATVELRTRRHGEVAFRVEHRHRQGDEHRSRGRGSGVVERAAHDRAELVDRAHLVHPLRDGPRQTHEVAGQQRVGDDVAPVLLTGGHDER